MLQQALSALDLLASCDEQVSFQQAPQPKSVNNNSRHSSVPSLSSAYIPQALRCPTL